MVENVPAKVQIGVYSFEVSIDPEYIEKVGAEREEELAGISELEQQKITMGVFPHDYTADTLLHEILHMCLRATACNINDEVVVDGVTDIEERLVSALTGILLDTLRRNPKLVSYLTSKK